MRQPRVRVEPADPQGPQAMSLLREAALEARQLYPEFSDPNAPMPKNPPVPQRGAYFIAFLNNDLAARFDARRNNRGSTSHVRHPFLPQNRRWVDFAGTSGANSGRSGFQNNAPRNWESSATRDDVV